MQRGTSLIELLITLALGSLVLTCISTALVRGHHSYALLAATTEAALSREKAASALGAAVRALDRHRLDIGWIVVKGEQISTMDHPVARLRGTSAPRQSSDILSVIETSPLHRGRIISSDLRGTAVSLRVCELQGLPSLSQVRSFLVLGFHGPIYLLASTLQETNGCLELQGSIVSSIFASKAQPGGSLHILLPIQREYSLFVDRSSQLRLVSHTASRILENQPVVRGISFVRISARQETEGALLFSLMVQPIGGRAATTLLFPATTRRPIWNELLL